MRVWSNMTSICYENLIFIRVIICLLVTLETLSIHHVECHGTMIDPVSRNSLWRIDPDAPVNYNDIELFCGGFGVFTSTGGRCGVCGDSIKLPRPRPHETGGKMAMNKTMRNFFPGATMDIMVHLVTNHGGYFEFDICRRNSFAQVEDDSCFEKLKFADGSSQFVLTNAQSEQGYRTLSLAMPEGLRDCPACILRWNYRAGNNWGICSNGTVGVGCGHQELYRNCADISIGYGHFYSDILSAATAPS